jgi:hypothetical protein
MRSKWKADSIVLRGTSRKLLIHYSRLEWANWRIYCDAVNWSSPSTLGSRPIEVRRIGRSFY